jgi:hypothetical protein
MTLILVITTIVYSELAHNVYVLAILVGRLVTNAAVMQGRDSYKYITHAAFAIYSSVVTNSLEID